MRFIILSHIVKRIYLFCIISLLLCSAIGLSSCDEIVDSRIPPARVSLNANINHYRELQGLKIDGGYATLTQKLNASTYIGYGGLLICRSKYGDNNVYAYDLACPVENKPTVRLNFKDGLIAVCPECHSEFDSVIFGSPQPTKGVAREKGYHLRVYPASWNDPMIIIRN